MPFPAKPTRKILYVCPSAGLGGVETFITTTWKHHKKSHWSPFYLLFREGVLTKELRDLGAPVQLLSAPPRLSRPRTWITGSREIARFARENHIDLIHSAMAYGALFTASAAKREHIPHLWFQHGPASGWMDRAAAIFPHSAVILNSQYTAQAQGALENPVSFCLPSRTQHIVHLGIDSSAIPAEKSEHVRAELEQRHPQLRGSLIFGMACRMEAWKGPHQAIEAVRWLRAQNLNKKFHLILWGEAFGDRSYFEKLKVDSQNLPVIFDGAPKNMRSYFSVCSAVINASTQPEPFGLTLIEAMSVGAIPMAPAWGGPLEIITNDHDGVLFRPLSSEDLGRNLQSLLNDGDKIKRLSQAARSTFQKRFTAETMMLKLEEIYDQVLDQSMK